MISAVNVRPQIKVFNPVFNKNTQFATNTNNTTTQNLPSLYNNNKISPHFALSFQANSNINVLKAFENLDESLKDFDRHKNFVSLDFETGKVKVTNNKNLEKDLNVIFNKFPVLKQTVYRNNSNNRKIIVHLLETTKELVTDPEFQKLSPSDKRLARICSMFHDAEKRIDLPDKGKNHPAICAKTIVREFGKFGFNEKDLFSMHQIVKNHHWVGQLHNCETTKDTIALEFKDCPDAFNIEILLSKADIKAGGNAKYIKDFSGIYHPGVSSEIKEKIKELQD